MLAIGDLKYWAIEHACGKRIPEFGRETGCSFRLGHWRKPRPGIRIQNGTQFPVERSIGNCIPEFELRLGRAFRSELHGKQHPGTCAQNGSCFPAEPSSGRCIPESTLKTGRAFLGVAPRPLRAAPDPNLSHLYIDFNRSAQNSNSASTCAFENLNSQR